MDKRQTRDMDGKYDVQKQLCNRILQATER